MVRNRGRLACGGGCLRRRAARGYEPQLPGTGTSASPQGQRHTAPGTQGGAAGPCQPGLGHGVIGTAVDAASKPVTTSGPSLKISAQEALPISALPPPFPCTVVASSSGTPAPASRLAARV